MFKYIFAVLFFALSIVFLMSWGLIKEQRKRSELYQKLLIKVENEIMKTLKKNRLLSKKEMMGLIKNTETKLFWSRSKIEVTDAERIVDQVLEKMLENSIIEKKHKKYELIHNRRQV